ncbi:MAG TPA: hypothetical protein VMT99_01690 [Candidatus Paceibacterota bacterium]|nr:hypothetical protein [Candidatus Paceibacterota bacterium]
MKDQRTGFSLIDVLISIAIFAVVSVAFVSIYVTVVQVQSYDLCESRAVQQGQFVLQQLEYYIGNARSIYVDGNFNGWDAGTSKLSLVPADQSFYPTTIGGNGTIGNFTLQQGTSSASSLIDSQTQVVGGIGGQYVFLPHWNISSSSAYGSESVSTNFTLNEYSSSQNTSTPCYSQTFQASIPVLAPVPAISLMHATATFDNINFPQSISMINLVHSKELVLVLVETNPSSSVITVTSTLGGTYANIATIKSKDDNTVMGLFQSSLSQTGTDTIHVYMSPGGYYEFYAFDYLYTSGFPSSSPSLVATNTLLNSSTNWISAGGVSSSPAASELVFGADTCGICAYAVSPGPGFASEGAITDYAVIAEDKNEYVTGPIDAPFYYGNSTVTSSALMAVFK